MTYSKSDTQSLKELLGRIPIPTERKYQIKVPLPKEGGFHLFLYCSNCQTVWGYPEVKKGRFEKDAWNHTCPSCGGKGDEVWTL